MSIAEETRRIYHAQHNRVAADKAAMERFVAMFTHEYFGLDRTYFSGARAIDVGCGNTGKLLIGLHNLGCRDITGIDLGDEFIDPTKESLARYGMAGVALKPGSVLDIPFPDNSFDFVACHGVMIHLATITEVERAFAELARITKPGGLLYTVFGVVGGLIEAAIIPALREHYRTNTEFRTLIDTIEPATFAHLIDLSQAGIQQHEGQQIDLSSLMPLFDVDLCVTLQNIVQAPVRLACDQATIEHLYSSNGLEHPRRLKRYVKRSNVRRFAAPLHYATDDPLVKIIYGSGNLEFIARKTP